MSKFSNAPATPIRGDDVRPWYKHGMVWMVVAIPCIAVLLGISLLVIAINSYDGLVEDDYYRYGKEINRTLARDEFARQHGISAQLTWPQNGQIEVQLAHNASLVTPNELLLKLIHRTRAGRDSTITLLPTPSGSFVGLTKADRANHWLVQLETSQWRLVSEHDQSSPYTSLTPP